MQRPGKPIEPSDAHRLYLALEREHSYSGVRLRAIVALAHGGALNLHEVLALTMHDVSIAGELRAFPIIVRVGGQRAVLPPSCEKPLRAYLARRAAEDFGNQLFKITARSVQKSFATLQTRAVLAARYRFSDLRHDALIHVGKVTHSAAAVADFGRLRRLKNALRFLPRPSRMSAADLAKLADR